MTLFDQSLGQIIWLQDLSFGQQTDLWYEINISEGVEPLDLLRFISVFSHETYSLLFYISFKILSKILVFYVEIGGKSNKT